MEALFKTLAIILVAAGMLAVGTREIARARRPKDYLMGGVWVALGLSLTCAAAVGVG